MEKKRGKEKAELRIDANEELIPREMIVYDGKYMGKDEYTQFLYKENEMIKEKNTELEKRAGYAIECAERLIGEKEDLTKYVMLLEEQIRLLEEKITLIKENSQLRLDTKYAEYINALNERDDLEDLID